MILWGSESNRFYDTLVDAIATAKEMTLHRAHYDGRQLKTVLVIRDIESDMLAMVHELLRDTNLSSNIATLVNDDCDQHELRRQSLGLIFDGFIFASQGDTQLRYRIAAALTHYRSKREHKWSFVRAVVESLAIGMGDKEARAFIEWWFAKHRGTALFVDIPNEERDSYLRARGCVVNWDE